MVAQGKFRSTRAEPQNVIHAPMYVWSGAVYSALSGRACVDHSTIRWTMPPSSSPDPGASVPTVEVDVRRYRTKKNLGSFLGFHSIVNPVRSSEEESWRWLALRIPAPRPEPRRLRAPFQQAPWS